MHSLAPFNDELFFLTILIGNIKVYVTSNVALKTIIVMIFIVLLLRAYQPALLCTGLLKLLTYQQGCYL